MNRAVKNIISIVCISSVLTGCGIKRTDTKAEAEKSAVTQASSHGQEVSSFASELPDLPLYDRNNAESSLLSMSEGKNTVAVFYTSWCPHCRNYIPLADEVYRKENGNVNFVFVNLIDSGENIRETRESGMKYHTEKAYAFPYYSADIKKSAESFGIKKIPLVLFYGKDGKLKGSLQEEFTKEDVIRETESLRKN